MKHALQEAASEAEADSPALQRRLAELADAVAARDNFIAVAAHELRNPMTPMIGQIELLLAGVKSAKYSQHQIEERLGRIHQSMRHYIKRASLLLDISRITSGKLSLAPESCDLIQIARHVIDAFAEAARHTGSHILLDAPQALHGTWDRLAVEQIMDNLVSNALKYGGRQQIRVSIGSNHDNGTISLQVRDHGPGISADNRARIFGQFERAVAPGEGQIGFGIGLWVVGQLVDVMRGSITVDDAEGGGAVFVVTLPQHVKVDAGA